MEVDLGMELGAAGASLGQRLTLYVPNKDKDGRELSDQERWVKAARELLTFIGRGSTALPPADGTWLDDQGNILWEQTRIIYCFVRPEKLRERMAELRAFLHRFGRETNQGEVIVEFDGRFWGIRTFDQPSGSQS